MKHDNSKEISLDDLIYNQIRYKHAILGRALTNEELDKAVEIIGDDCQQKTKDKLSRRLQTLSLLTRHVIYSRLLFQSDGAQCQYVAGQSYSDEIRTIRQLILKG